MTAFASPSQIYSWIMSQFQQKISYFKSSQTYLNIWTQCWRSMMSIVVSLQSTLMSIWLEIICCELNFILIVTIIMASQVKVQTSDIKSQSLKTLLTNLVKHAFSTLINDVQYRPLLEEQNKELSEIMKLSKFKKDLVWFLTN